MQFSLSRRSRRRRWHLPAHRVPRPFQFWVAEVRKESENSSNAIASAPAVGAGAGRGRRHPAQLGGRGRRACGAVSGLECSRGGVLCSGDGGGWSGAGLQGPWVLEGSQLSFPREPVGGGAEEDLSSSQAGQLRGNQGTPGFYCQLCHGLAACPVDLVS